MSKLTAEEIERRTSLVNQGLSNKEIAEMCHTTANAITSWRWRTGLSTRRQRLTEDDEQVRMELYERGLSDQEMADVLHISVYTVRDWRMCNGLYRGTPRGAKEDGAYDDGGAQARRENVQGIIDDERKAREMGMSYGEYSSMRSGRPIRRRRKQTVEWTPLVVKI